MKVLTKELLTVEKPYAKYKGAAPLNLAAEMRISEGKQGSIVEFIGTGDFGTQWNNRQKFEVDAGRDMEPELWKVLYDVMEDSSLPKSFQVSRIGPGQALFGVVPEGGEVHWITIDNTNFTVTLQHIALGLKYSKDLVVFNDMWNVPMVERQIGIAYNAYRNNLFLAPFIQYAYTSNNQTVASAQGTTLNEKRLNTLADAVSHAMDDTTNPRRGPFALLCSTRDTLIWQQILNPVAQYGINLNSPVADKISTIIGYNGWTGKRGLLTETYPGVTSGTCYLIDLGYKTRNMRAFIKQDFQRTVGEGDVSRFILEELVYDAYLAGYTDVAASTEQIVLPTS